MRYLTRFTPLILVFTMLTSGCTYLGEYTYGGEFPNIQLPAKGKVIGMLDPRGPFGDKQAKDLFQKRMRQYFGKCDRTVLLTEEGLNERGLLPAIYGASLSEDNLKWFVEKTKLDYLVFPDIGPGALQDMPESFQNSTADLEASVRLIVYDLNDGGELKSITVNAQLDYDVDRNLWELEPSEKKLGQAALNKAVLRLAKFTNCP